MSSIHIKPTRLIIAFLAVGVVALTVPTPSSMPLQNTLAELFAIWESERS